MGNYYLVAAVSGTMLKEGLKNMIVGLGVVFAVLILLCIIIWAFKFLGNFGAKDAASEAPQAPKSAPRPAVAGATSFGPGQMSEAAVEFEDVDADTAAVILGAVAEECGGNFEVTSIKKSK